MDGPLTRGQITRQRLLEAAAEEFAEFGVAGARVDRIATAARSNKAQLYDYFGSKDKLFDAVSAERIDAVVTEVRLDGRDLAGYAVRLYDVYLDYPELVRLATWTRLERQPGGALPAANDAPSLAEIVRGQELGEIDPHYSPEDVLSIVTAMAMTWSAASALITATVDEAESVHRRRRGALRTAVERAFRVS